MSWKRYFTPVTSGSSSPLTKTSTTKPTRSNYSSYLPDIYSGHPNRLERYAQYDTMDLDPEVNAAFDILSEFCTQTNEENGTPFQIFFKEQATATEVKIVKKYLQQWCKLNDFHTRIFKIVRNTFKYGDCFFVRDPETQSWFYVDPSKVDKIIVNESEGKKPEQYVIRDLNVNFENLTVTQINPSNQNTTPGGTTYVTGGVHQRGMVGAYPQSAGTRFSINQNQWAIDAEHVIHVSLSEGLDNNFPFGNSLMETIFKVYKQKELLEDAIIIYRVQRAPERRVFYIDVGNMPSHLAMSFVERVKNEVNQRRIPSLTGGGQSVIDSGFNPLAINEDYFFPQTAEGRGSKIDVLPGGCLAMDTIVPLLDGRKLSISELATEYQQGKVNWTFSTDPQTGKVVPGLISWAGVTQKSAKVMKLTFDNGQNLICTPDHKFPILGQDAVAAKDLKLGQRLIPFNSRNSNISPTKKRQYTEVYQNDIKEWKFVHREVVSFFENFDIIKEMVFDEKYLDSKKDTIHHVDHNRYNNNPENLVMMNFKDHQRYHAYYGFSSESQKKGTIAASKYFDSLRKDPVLWEKFIQEKRKTSKEQWENLSSTERLSRIKNITAGIISHFQNMSNSDRELLRQRNSEKSKLGISTHLLNLNDPNYYKEFVSSITNGWDSFRNTEEYFARNRKISKANAERMADLNYKERVFKNQRVKYSKDLLNQLQSAMLQSSSTWSIDQAVNYINEDSELLSLHLEINKDTVCANWNNDKITRTQLIGLVKFFGYQNWKHFKNDIKCYNHEIISIEFLDEPIEVGTLTIDQQEIYHNHHNFALDIGIFTNNSNLGEIDDLLFFTQKMMRALRIPSSYLPTGVDDSQAIFSDGKVGTAYIQELRFNNYCMRLQNLMREKFDDEFKRYLVKKGMNIDLNLFDIKFNPPQNFASYRQAEMDSARINSFGSISAVPYLSKRFALKRYLGLSAEEIAENEKLWQEENGEAKLTTTQNDMRDMGITPGGLSDDLSQLGQSDLGPEGMEPNIDTGTEAVQPASSPASPPVGPTSSPPTGI